MLDEREVAKLATERMFDLYKSDKTLNAYVNDAVDEFTGEETSDVIIHLLTNAFSTWNTERVPEKHKLAAELMIEKVNIMLLFDRIPCLEEEVLQNNDKFCCEDFVENFRHVFYAGMYAEWGTLFVKILAYKLNINVEKAIKKNDELRDRLYRLIGKGGKDND